MWRLAYTVLLPLIEQMLRRFFERSLRAKQRRENGLQHVSSSVVHEAVHMIRWGTRLVAWLLQDGEVLQPRGQAPGARVAGGQWNGQSLAGIRTVIKSSAFKGEKVQLGRLKHGAALRCWCSSA